ncbi:hypothetical protein A3A75_03145 [Candidatus Woesebacteria bacterium RIFCSPLOWO2_01_FULL_39_10]|uniref:Nudix hydrolase domain-containing protein n=1 Tax=Candidatus Woesebacteria bacterium RIFCSPLOWO2_01_FULL_39_10 TaxID=1802516 RepID=A0A1F8B581_9BACT|nr:MAG: hypothetical protein A3A75_03145 [Candidatus Woesebacteria bacterium RIFCSPLOWO2_01_FULL_39_10]
MKRQFTAGGVVYKRENSKGKDEPLWLITKSSPSEIFPTTFWRLPKGWLDDEDQGKNPGPKTTGEKKATEEEIREAAKREVREEGGVEAKIVKKIQTERFFITYEGDRILKFITYFLMEYISDLPEGFGFETSEIAWLPYEEARNKLKHSSEKKILDKAKNILDSGVQENLI